MRTTPIIALALALAAQLFAGTRADAGTAGTTALPPGYTVNGIDVSSHDHDGKTLNWADRRAAGEEFAFVKATEGTSYVNPYFGQDNQGAKAAGLYVGAYAFGRPDLGNPAGQANHFADNLQWSTDGRTLPPFLDLEWPYLSGTPDCYGLSQSEMRSWISTFLTTVQARIGRTPMIYTNVNWWNPCTGSSGAFSGYPLDISSCGSTPPSVPGWGSNWTFWQYDIDACKRGAAHDSMVFNGSVAQLAALAGGSGGGVTAGDVTGDGKADLVARRTDGTLWLYRNSGSTTPYGSGAQVGVSWQQFLRVLSGDVNGDHRADLVAVRADGTLWLYLNGGNDTSPYGTGTQIGTGWQQFRHVLLADVTGDSRADLVAARQDGTLWLYANGGNDSAPYSAGGQIGTGWGVFTRIAAGDVTGDGRADLVGVQPDGTMSLYANGGSDSAPYSAGGRIGTGWQPFDRVLLGDTNGDNRADVVATKADGSLWLYVNTGNASAPYSAGALIGDGWQQFA
ncbi:GH25 family lysozyme [Lentzea sp.]|uniref:GH25 family lysozyme n=1 Tax=Lentzea sp. TaxID=56099 RepID=UPI002ED67E7D